MKVLLLALSVFILSCQEQEKKSSSYPMKEKILKNQSIGKEFNAHAFTNIYFADQPSKADFEQLKQQGFSTIINLRHPKEDGEDSYSSEDEAKWAKSQDFRYYQIPMDKEREISADQINEITSKVKEHRKDGKILVHCGTGNRAAVWAGAHFYLDHQFNKEDAMEIAKDLGLNKPKAEKKLANFLDKK